MLSCNSLKLSRFTGNPEFVSLFLDRAMYTIQVLFGVKASLGPLVLGLLKASFIALDGVWWLWQLVALLKNSVTATLFQKGTGNSRGARQSKVSSLPYQLY